MNPKLPIICLLLTFPVSAYHHKLYSYWKNWHVLSMQCFFMLPECVTQSCLTLCNSARLQPTKLPRVWDFPGKNPGVGCHFLLQGIFPTQGSNPGLPNCRRTLYCLSHQGKGNPLFNLLCPYKYCFFCLKCFIPFLALLFLTIQCKLHMLGKDFPGDFNCHL